MHAGLSLPAAAGAVAPAAGPPAVPAAAVPAAACRASPAAPPPRLPAAPPHWRLPQPPPPPRRNCRRPPFPACPPFCRACAPGTPAPPLPPLPRPRRRPQREPPPRSWRTARAASRRATRAFGPSARQGPRRPARGRGTCSPPRACRSLPGRRRAGAGTLRAARPSAARSARHPRAPWIWPFRVCPARRQARLSWSVCARPRRRLPARRPAGRARRGAGRPCRAASCTPRPRRRRQRRSKEALSLASGVPLDPRVLSNLGVGEPAARAPVVALVVRVAAAPAAPYVDVLLREAAHRGRALYHGASASLPAPSWAAARS